MLRSCSENEFDRYADFAYELAMDLAKSAYPTYCDKIKTKAAFIERSHKAFERETEQMLLFVYEGEVQGLIHYCWIPDDRYLQTICFNINVAAEQALSEFFAYIGGRFKGYEVYSGFPAENHPAVEYLIGHGFECVENDYNNTAFLDSFDRMPENNGITRIRKDNYERFETLHRQIEGDMYWNSERMLANLDDWVIFVKEQRGVPQGAVYFREINDGWFEIFGIDIDHDGYDPELFREMLNTALYDAKKRNGRFMTFFCDEDYEETAKECGFMCVGKYLCYKTRLE